MTNPNPFILAAKAAFAELTTPQAFQWYRDTAVTTWNKLSELGNALVAVAVESYAEIQAEAELLRESDPQQAEIVDDLLMQPQSRPPQTLDLQERLKERLGKRWVFYSTPTGSDANTTQSFQRVDYQAKLDECAKGRSQTDRPEIDHKNEPMD